MDESTNSMPFTMPVAPAYGNGGGFGGFGNDWAWLIILLLAFNGGFGNGFGGGFGGGYEFPWLLNGQNGINANTDNGFNHAATQTALSGIQSSITSGFGDIQNSLCGGFAGVTAAVTGAQNAVAQQMYANQIADLERSFAAQTASTQGMSALQSQLATCCCDNRSATQDVKYTIATEACNTRAANSANTQAILDKLCQLELAGKDSRISDLERQLTLANLNASQTAQTAQILAGQAAEIDGVYNRLKSCPVGTYSVANPTSCGCGSF